MALELEQIQPWDGQSGTGAEVRGALNRNFEKLKDLSILAGMPIKDLFTSVDLLPRPGISGNNYLVGENLYVWSESVLDYVDIGSVKGQDGLDGIDGKDSKQVTTVAYDGTRPVLRLLTDGSGVSYPVPTFSKSDGSTTTIITEAATYTNAEALSSKVDKGGSDKTLKQVEDEIVQLAGKTNLIDRKLPDDFDNYMSIEDIKIVTEIRENRILSDVVEYTLSGDGIAKRYIVNSGEKLRIQTRYTGTGSALYLLFSDSVFYESGAHVQNMSSDVTFYINVPDNGAVWAMWVISSAGFETTVESLSTVTIKDVVSKSHNLLNTLIWESLYYRSIDHALVNATVAKTTPPIKIEALSLSSLSINTINLNTHSICLFDDKMNFLHGLEGAIGNKIVTSDFHNALNTYPQAKYVTFTINPNVATNAIFGTLNNEDAYNFLHSPSDLYTIGNLSDLQLIDEYFRKDTNSFRPHATLKRTDFLDLDIYNFIYTDIEGNEYVWVVSFWDENKTFISGIGVDELNNRLRLPINDLRPEGAKYVIFSISSINYNNIEFRIRNFVLRNGATSDDALIAQVATIFKTQDRKYRNCLGGINLSNYSEMNATKKGDFFICTEKGDSHYIHDCEVGYEDALFYNGQHYERGTVIPTSDLIVSNNHVNEYDVCILGGGGGGVGAAYSLIDKGLKVCIVERAPLLGGTHTAGMVVDFCATPVGEWFKEKIFTPMNQAGRMNIQRFEGPILPPTEENYNLTNICYYDPDTGNHYDPGMITFDRIAVSNHYYDDFSSAGFDIKLNRKFIEHTKSFDFSKLEFALSGEIYRVSGEIVPSASWENSGFIPVKAGNILKVRTKGSGNEGDDLVIFFENESGAGGSVLQESYNGIVEYNEYTILNDGYVVVNNNIYPYSITLEISIGNGQVACEEILVENMINGVQEKISAKFFIDCSGDGYLVRSLCPVEDEDFYIGTDPKNRFNESLYLDSATPSRYSLNALENSFRIELDGANREDLSNIEPISGVNAAINYTFTDRTNPALKIISPSTGQNVSIAKFVDEGYDAAMKDGLRKLPYCWKLTKEARNLQDYRFAHPGEILSIREGYRIACDNTITQDDITQRVTSATDIITKRFIALSTWYLDFHGGAGAGIDMDAAKALPVDCFGIPIDALFPKKLRNVMIACRGLGVSHIASAATRITKTMMSIGYASGLAAEQFVKNELTNMREVDVQKIQSDIKLSELIAVMETLYPLNPYNN